MLIMPADGGGPVELPVHPASTSGAAPKAGATGSNGGTGTVVAAGQVNAANLSAQQALLAAEQETARRLAVAQAQTKVVQAALQKQYPYGMSDAQWQAYLQKDPQGQQFNQDWLAVQRSASNQLRLAADGAKDPGGAGAAIDSEAAKLKASGNGDATLNQVVDDAAQSVKGQSAAARATSERAFRMEIVSQTPGATDAQKSAALDDFNQALGHEIALQAAQQHLQNAQADMAALNKLPGGVRRAEYGEVSSELSQAQSEYAQVQAGHDDAGVDVSPAEQQQAAQAVAQGHSTELYALGAKSDPLSVPGETAVISAQQMLQHYVAKVDPNDPTLTAAQKQLAQSDPVAFAQVQMSGVQIDPSQIKNGWEKQLAQSNPLEYAIYKMTGVDATGVNPDDPSLSATDKTQLHNKDYLQYAMAHASPEAQAKIGLLLGSGQTVRFNRVQSQVNQLTQGTRTSANDAKALQILQTNMSQALLPGEADALWQNIGAPKFSASYIQSQYAALIQSPGQNATPAQKNDATMNADKVGVWLQQVTKNAPPQFAALALQTLRQNFNGQWFESNSGMPDAMRGEDIYKGLSQAVQVADQQDPSHAEANKMAAWLLDAGNTTATGKSGTLIYVIQGSAGSGMMLFQSVRDAMSGGYGTDLSDALNAQIYNAKNVPANNFTQAYQLGAQEAAGKQNAQYAQQSYQSFLQAAPATLQAYFNDIGQHYGTGASQFGDTTQLDNFIAAGLNMAPDAVAMPTAPGANGQGTQAQSPLMAAQWLRQAGYAAPQSGGKPVSNEAWAQLIVNGQYALPLSGQAQLLTPQQLAKLLATGQYAHVAAPTDGQGKALSEQQIVQALSAGKYQIPAAGLVNFSAQATLDGRHAVPVDIYGKPLSEGELLHQISIGTYRGENLYAHNPKFADIVSPVAKQLQTVAGVSLPSQASAAGASGAPVLTVSLIPTFYASNDGGANPSGLFGVTDKGSHHTKLVDDRGWHYDNLSDYQHNNALGGGQLYVPTWLQSRNDAQPGGIELVSYSKGPAGAMDIAYSQVDSHQTTGWQHVEHFLDDALGLVAVVAGTALLFTGVGTGVGAALLGATAVGMGWGAYRSFDDLANLGEHGQAINPFAGGQATQDWVMGTVSLLALGASGATLRGARLLMLAKTLPEAEQAGMLADAMKWDTLASRINRPAMVGGTYQMASQGAALIHNWDQMSGYQKWSQLVSLGANMTPFFAGKYIKSLHGEITQQQGLSRSALSQAQAPAQTQAVAAANGLAYWTSWLDDAINTGKFKLQYQPLHDSLSGEISHYEVLIRHSDLRPDQFVPALEAHGLSLPLAQWVIAEAVRAAAGHPDVNLAINLSGPVLNHSSLPTFVDAVLAGYGVSATRISFEITETGDLPDMRVARDVLRRLRARGHEIAIDDFDQQRSLDYVSRLLARAAGTHLFDTLKIAREWVAALGDPDVREAVKVVVDDMHRTGIKVIGEGVETEEDSARLDALGVDIQQGWYWGRPGDLPEQAGLPDNMPPRPGKTADDGPVDEDEDGGNTGGGRGLSADFHPAPPPPLTDVQAWQLGLAQAGGPPVAALEQFPSLGTQSAMGALDPDAVSAALVAKGVATDTAQAFVAQLVEGGGAVPIEPRWTAAPGDKPAPNPVGVAPPQAVVVFAADGKLRLARVVLYGGIDDHASAYDALHQATLGPAPPPVWDYGANVVSARHFSGWRKILELFMQLEWRWSGNRFGNRRAPGLPRNDEEMIVVMGDLVSGTEAQRLSNISGKPVHVVQDQAWQTFLPANNDLADFALAERNGRVVALPGNRPDQAIPLEDALGPMIDQGADKIVFALGKKFCVAIMRPDRFIDGGAKGNLSAGERYQETIDGVNEANALGIPVLGYRTVKIFGRFAFVFDRYALSSKSVVGPSPILNERTLGTLQHIRGVVVANRIGVGDAEFLVGGHGFQEEGQTVLADPRDITVGDEAASRKFLEIIDGFVQHVRESLLFRQGERAGAAGLHQSMANATVVSPIDGELWAAQCDLPGGDAQRRAVLAGLPTAGSSAARGAIAGTGNRVWDAASNVPANSGGVVLDAAAFSATEAQQISNLTGKRVLLPGEKTGWREYRPTTPGDSSYNFSTHPYNGKTMAFPAGQPGKAIPLEDALGGPIGTGPGFTALRLDEQHDLLLLTPRPAAPGDAGAVDVTSVPDDQVLGWLRTGTLARRDPNHALAVRWAAGFAKLKQLGFPMADISPVRCFGGLGFIRDRAVAGTAWTNGSDAILGARALSDLIRIRNLARTHGIDLIDPEFLLMPDGRVLLGDPGVIQRAPSPDALDVAITRLYRSGRLGRPPAPESQAQENRPPADDSSGDYTLSAQYHRAPPPPLTEMQIWQLGLAQAGSPPVAALEQFPSLGTQSAMGALDPDAVSAALVAKGVATDTAQAFVGQLAQAPEPVIGTVSWTSARDAQPSPAPASTETSSASNVNDQPFTGEVPEGATAQAILAHPVYGPVARKFAQYLVTEDRLAPRWAQRAVYARSLGDKLRNALAASGQHAANPGAHADFDAFVADRLRRDAGTFLRNALMYLDKGAHRQAKLDAQLSALPPGMLGSAAFHDAVQVARDEILGKRSSAPDTPDAPDEGDPPQDRYTVSAQYHRAPPAPLTDAQAWQLGLTQAGSPPVTTMEPYISQVTHQAMRGIDPSTLYPELLRIGLSENTARAFVGQLQQDPSHAVVVSAEMDVRPQDVDMSRAVPVISTAQKFILPIPPLTDGEPLVYPAGTIDAGGALLDGQPILDRQGNPLGETGVVFHNAKDQSLQAVPGDGSGVIIFNEVTEAQAVALSAAVTDLAGTPDALTHAQVVALLDVATSLGLTDCYNSDTGFVRGNMTPVGDLGADCFGLYKRGDHDTCWAVRLVGRGTFKGPAASPQRFDSGAVIVRQGDEYRLVQPAEFGRTYCHSDATPIDVMALPVGLRGFSLDGFLDTAPPRQTEDAGAVPAGASAGTPAPNSLGLTYAKSGSGNWLFLSSSSDPGVSVKVQIGAVDHSSAEGAPVINVQELKAGQTALGSEGWLLMALLDHYAVLPSSGTLLVFPDVMDLSLLAAYGEGGDPAGTPLGASLSGALPAYGFEISGFQFDDHAEQLSLVVSVRGREQTQTPPPGDDQTPGGGSTLSAAYYPEPQQPPDGPAGESTAARLFNSRIGALDQVPSPGARRAASQLNPDLLQAQLLDIGLTPGTAREFVAQLSAPSPQHVVPRYWFADGRDAGEHASTPFDDAEHERFGLTYGYGRGLLGLFSASDPKVKLSVGINVDAEGYLLDPAADKFNIFMIDRGDLPPGAGSRMLLTLLQHFDIGLAPTGRATIEAIVDQSAIDAFEHQTDPAQTRLARSLARALSAHGLSAEFEFEGTNKDDLSLVARWHPAAAAGITSETEAPLTGEPANDAPQQGLYVSRPVDPASAQRILGLAQAALSGDINWVPPHEMHVTIVRSPNDLRDGEVFIPQPIQ